MSELEEDNILVDVSSFKEKVKKSTKINLFKFIARSFFSISTLTLILVYLLSPLGKVKINKLSGNYYLSSNDVLKLANLSKKDSLLKVREDVLMNRLNASSYISSSSVKWHMTYLNIYVDEVAPIAKSKKDIILSNGILLEDYQVRHDDYVIDETVDLPEFIDYSGSKDSALFLNSLKYLNKDLFKLIQYLDEGAITFNDYVSEETYFSVFFKRNDALLRIRFEKSIIKDALCETKVLTDAINVYKSFNTVTLQINGDELEVYEGIYRYDEDTRSYKVVTLVERS